MTDRSADTAAFLSAIGWGEAVRTHLAGDASNRRYERLRGPDEKEAVLMDAPPDKGEDVRPFVALATHLSGLGLSAPEIIAQDTARGFLLLEDLGDALFARLMADDPDTQSPLYSAAIDVLLTLRAASAPTLPAYDNQRMTDLAALAFGEYASAAGHDASAADDAFRIAFPAVLSDHATAPGILVHRDFHAENLIWLPERTGAARVGLLDFQDAMLGHPAYDLVSLLQDARRDVPADTQTAMFDLYVRQSGDDPTTFGAAYAVLGVQRNLRILGVFARLCRQYGKPSYVDLIPRVWAYLMQDLAHPTLAPVAGIITDALPEPTPETLNVIRATCPTR